MLQCDNRTVLVQKINRVLQNCDSIATELFYNCVMALFCNSCYGTVLEQILELCLCDFYFFPYGHVILYHKSNLVYSFFSQFLIFQQNTSAQTSVLIFFTSRHYYFFEKLKIVEKTLCKLNCSYGEVSHTLKLSGIRLAYVEFIGHNGGIINLYRNFRHTRHSCTKPGKFKPQVDSNRCH